MCSMSFVVLLGIPIENRMPICFCLFFFFFLFFFFRRFGFRTITLERLDRLPWNFQKTSQVLCHCALLFFGIFQNPRWPPDAIFLENWHFVVYWSSSAFPDDNSWTPGPIALKFSGNIACTLPLCAIVFRHFPNGGHFEKKFRSLFFNATFCFRQF